MKIIKSLFVLFLMILSLRAVAIESDADDSLPMREVMLNGHVFQVKIAQSAKALKQGLMGREFLATNEGMLFIFPRQGKHGIWMKNMQIPLQVIWLDEDYTVVDLKTLQPCVTFFCPSYKPSINARYVLELHHSSKINKGDRLIYQD